MRPAFIFCAALFLLACPSFSMEPEDVKNNFAAEAAWCSAYFMILSAGVANTPQSPEGLENRLEMLSYQAFAISKEFSNQETLDARLQLAWEDIMSLIESDYANIARANVKYEKSCVNLIKDPAARLKEWAAK